MVLEKDPSFAGPQHIVPVELEAARVVENVPYYRDTTALGVLQWLTRTYLFLLADILLVLNNHALQSCRGIPLQQAPLYGLWRPKDSNWIDELKVLTSCGLEPLETLILKKRYATTADAPYKLDDACSEEPTPPQAGPFQQSDNRKFIALLLTARSNCATRAAAGRQRFRTTSASFMKVKEELGGKNNQSEPRVDSWL